MTETRPWLAFSIQLRLLVLLALFVSAGTLRGADPQQDNPAPAADDASDSARRDTAHAQFLRAEALRNQLEAKTERERSLQEYQAVASAYRRVYLITPRGAEVPIAIKMVGDIYRHMGEQFDPKYFDSAAVSYEFLLHDYPANRYREDVLLALAEIQKNGLSRPELAQQAYENFLKLYPHSPHAADARKALADLQAAEGQKAAAPDQVAQAAAPAVQTDVQPRDAKPPDTKPKDAKPKLVAKPTANGAVANTGSVPASGERAQPNSTDSEGQSSELTAVRIAADDRSTRVTVEFTGALKYDAARLSHPDRIYLDLQGARVTPKLIRQADDLPATGYVKNLRLGQNRSQVARLVMEVAPGSDFSVVQLSEPGRLVIDLHADGAAAPSEASAKIAGPGSTATPSNSATAESEPTIASPKNPTTAATPRAAQRQLSAASAIRTQQLPITSRPAIFNLVALVPPDSVASASAAVRPRAVTKPVPAVVAVRTQQLPLTSRPATLSLLASVAPPGSSPAPTVAANRPAERSLTRVLGLKIGRIVIDAGHGGHDTGTIGMNGLMEKDLCLDVAMRLGTLIAQRVPTAGVVYTRSDDSFVPLEQRTAIANRARADLFISIHANSSSESKVRGIETYYLNFDASPQALEVAARENALAQSSIHDLQDFVKKIARNEKVEESRELAVDIQDSLVTYMRAASRPERNRGVRKAPFVVLINAEMPSVLAEISFLSNPADEQWLKSPDNRQRVAEGLYHGIEKYLRSTNSLTTNLASSGEVAREETLRQQ